jgi:hypothetical protein
MQTNKRTFYNALQKINVLITARYGYARLRTELHLRHIMHIMHK